MKISRTSLILTSIILTLLALVALALVALATTLMPSAPSARALSGATNLEPTPPALDADLYVVRAYYDNYQMVNDLSTWTEPWEVYSDLGFVVLGVSRADLNLLQVLGFRVEIDEEMTRALTEPRPTGPETGVGGYPTIPGYACYRTVEGTFMTAEDLVTNYPTLAQWVDAGDSWEKTQDINVGYDMMVLILTNQNIPGPKPKLMITSSIHAREYTPAELSTRFAEYLISNYGTNPDATWLLDHHEIHLMLHANPDGRKWAESGYSWRKNTNEAYCGSTSPNRGADLNRNFSYLWNCCGGSSGNQCDLTYRGPSAASEPEVQAIQNYLRAIFPDQRGSAVGDPAPADATGVYLDLHSYSRLVLWPWGGYNTPTANGSAFQTLGRKFAYFNAYTPVQSYELYPTDGTTVDFGYGDLGVASFVFELGNNFFESCSYFESTLLPQNLNALLYAAKTVRTPYLTPQGPEALSLTLSDTSVPQGTPVTLNATLNDTRFNNTQGSEPVDQIAAAEYYLDVPSWITTTVPVAYPMSPVDGNFNTSIENATAVIDTSTLAPGQHLIYVRGQDNDANAYWGPPTAIFLTIEAPLAEETLTKTVSVPTVQPGEIFTYTLSYQMEVAGANTYTLTLRDELPDGLTILTDTILLNGLPAPELYNPATDVLEVTQTGAVTGAYALNLTLQATADPALPGTEIANHFTTTLTLDANPATQQTSNVATITLLPATDPWLALEKTASVPSTSPGGTFTYTLSAQVILTGTHAYTLTLLDLLPAEVTVLTETILLDGVPAPWLYHPATHAISATLTGNFTAFVQPDITFVVLVHPSAPLIPLTNTLTGSAWVDAHPALYGGDATVLVPVYTSVYLPVIFKP
ncbi:MAG: isopeptide-forming domain-containing fimbrial protein [Anaerolineales bacterium]|nr:isopeptide-forming domain-containing fimbrial protein [Anaerolineales bacterium]